jgi:hypothetical protein
MPAHLVSPSNKPATRSYCWRAGAPPTFTILQPTEVYAGPIFQKHNGDACEPAVRNIRTWFRTVKVAERAAVAITKVTR